MYNVVEKDVAAAALNGACIDYLAIPYYYHDERYPDEIQVVVDANGAPFADVTFPNDPTW